MNAYAFEEWPFIMTFTMETRITHKCITENTQTSMTHHDLKREVCMCIHGYYIWSEGWTSFLGKMIPQQHFK